jgi:hypothetical protein
MEAELVHDIGEFPSCVVTGCEFEMTCMDKKAYLSLNVPGTFPGVHLKFKVSGFQPLELSSGCFSWML